MEDALKERAKILDELVPSIFKSEETPSESILKNILIHKALAEHPNKINNIKSIKVDVSALIDKYSVNCDIVESEKKIFICPITQSEVLKPWKADCGHVFEESAVLDALKRNMRCPVFGCNVRLSKSNKF